MIAEVGTRSELRFPVEEYRTRVERLRAELQSRGIDSYVATMPEHLNYFTGFDPTGIYFFQLAVFTPDLPEPILLTHKCEKELARVTCWIEDIRIWQHGEDPVARAVALLREVGVGRGTTVGMELEGWYLKPDHYLRVRRSLDDVRIIDVTDVGQELRMRKSPAEMHYMRQAAALAALGFAAAVESLAPGTREVDVLGAVQHALAVAGSEYPALPFIIGSGPRSGLFHNLATERVIEEGDPVMLEISGVKARYNSNIVRTVVVGTASSDLLGLHRIAYDAFWQAFEAVKPGIPVGEIDRITREVRREYADYIPSRAGFGMELAYPPVWLGRPDILEGDPHVLEPGMVFSLEPSVAMYEGITMIYGYNMVVTENGAEILHQIDPNLFEIRV